MNWKAGGRNHKRHKKHISFLCLLCLLCFLCFLWFQFPFVANSFTASMSAGFSWNQRNTAGQRPPLQFGLRVHNIFPQGRMLNFFHAITDLRAFCIGGASPPILELG